MQHHWSAWRTLEGESDGIYPLRVEHNTFYDIPTVAYDRFEEFDPMLFPRAIHYIPYEGLVIPALVQLAPGDFLAVTFAGAADRAKAQLPFFYRVKTSLANNEPCVLFSDPVLALSPTMRLGWYVGTDTIDIRDALIAIVQTVQAATEIQHVCFQGGSGGGFAALQMSARLSGSLAYVWAPQTDILRASDAYLQPYWDVAFPGVTRAAALERHADRLSTIPNYQRRDWKNVVYYVQNRGDTRHVEFHLRPFLAALGLEYVDGTYCDGRLQLELVDLGPGHLVPPPASWRSHLQHALKMLRD